MQLRLFTQERDLLRQPIPQSPVSTPNSLTMMELDDCPADDSAHADSAAWASSSEGMAPEQAAIRYHWARGGMAQLQGDQEQAVLHFSVCEELCRQ